MFLTIAGFILLVLFAAAAVGAIVMARHAVGVVRLRGKLEELKAKKQIEDAQHTLRVSEHQHGLQVLALTAGTSAEGKAGPPPEEPEEVSKKDTEVWSHPYPRHEWDEAQKLRKAATDAKFESL